MNFKQKYLFLCPKLQLFEEATSITGKHPHKNSETFILKESELQYRCTLIQILGKCSLKDSGLSLGSTCTSWQQIHLRRCRFIQKIRRERYRSVIQYNPLYFPPCVLTFHYLVRVFRVIPTFCWWTDNIWKRRKHISSTWTRDL